VGITDGYGELAEIHGDRLSVFKDHLHQLSAFLQLRTFLAWHTQVRRYP
jgi:hypothetical protein